MFILNFKKGIYTRLIYGLTKGRLGLKNNKVKNYIAARFIFKVPMYLSKTRIIMYVTLLGCFGSGVSLKGGIKVDSVSQMEMQRIYDEVKTPYKYGLVMVHPDTAGMVDSPTIFRKDSTWYMTYLVYSGKGYETWLAKSTNLLDWVPLDSILTFGKVGSWDASQSAGYASLINYNWGGDYAINSYKNKYWMSYLGGNAVGYEKGLLSIGMACTKQKPWIPHLWQHSKTPIMSSKDKNAGYWEKDLLFKSTVFEDSLLLTGKRFVMYYNASGDTAVPKKWVERIGMATSNDMLHWERHPNNPMIDHRVGISGDAYIQKIENLYVMFYFGIFWPNNRKDAFNKFACSYDLINWTDWTGEDLIKSSEPYDSKFAHKPCVVKWNGVVYHFYCAVNELEQRGIAVATSKDLGKGNLKFMPIQNKLKR